MRGDLESGERDARHANLCAAAAAINDGTGGENLCAGALEQFDYVVGAAAGGDDVFYDDGGIAGLYGEAAAEGHLAGFGIAFGKKVRRAEGAGHFMADDETAEGRGDDQGGSRGNNFAQLLGEQFAQFFGGGRVAQHERTLQVFPAVKTAGETEMTLKICAGFAEKLENGFSLRRHKRLLYH
jgi:hypothetical protein